MPQPRTMARCCRIVDPGDRLGRTVRCGARTLACSVHIRVNAFSLLRHKCSQECEHGTVCWACPAARKWKSSTQPDGGEGLAKRKGFVREAGSERSVEQKRDPMNKNPIRGTNVGRRSRALQI